MATHDYVIDNSTGANVRADINNVLQAILTNNSSSSAPSTTAAYMWWADTTTGILKIRNSANNGWVELLQLDGTLTLEDGSVSAPALAFRDDLNTGIFSSAADTFNVATAGVERMELGAATIFNEDGADVDFRIEGDTDALLFKLDAGNDRIGIGVSSPSTKLEVLNDFLVKGSSGDGSVGINIRSGGSAISNQHQIRTGGGSGEQLFIEALGSSSALVAKVAGSERARIDSSGKVLIGSTTADTGGVEINKSITAESDASDAANYHLVIKSQSNSNTAKVGIAFKNSSDSTVVGAAILHHRTAGGSIGDLAFYTSPSTGTTTQRMIIDKNGHMGLGLTPNTAWPSNGDFKAFQIGTGACVFGRGSGDEDRGGIAVNYYHTGSTEKYLANGNASGVLLNDGDIDFFTATANSSGANTTMSKTIAMRIASTTGKIGIGTTDPASPLHLHESSSGSIEGLKVTNSTTGTAIGDGLSIGLDSSENVFIFNYESTAIKFGTSGTERMRINSSGNILMGTTSVLNTGTLTIKGNGVVPLTTEASATSAFSQILFNNPNGIVGEIRSSGSSTSYLTNSDYRLKENIETLSDGITRLKTLKPYRFNWKTVSGQPKEDGFLAHEVTAVPEAVTGTKDEVDADNNPVYQGIDQSKLVPLLVAAVQELITKVETLEAA